MLSITIRPRKSNFDPQWQELLHNYFNKHLIPHVVGLEGDKDHLQVCVTTTVRSNNFRRTIKNLLQFVPEDEQESRTWLKINTHDDARYLIGYCMKENKFVTNIENDTLQDAQEYYNNRVEKLKQSTGSHKWVVSGMNNLLPHVFEFALTNDVLTYSLRSIVVTMFSQDLIPFSLARKITKKEEDLWQAYKLAHFSTSDIKEIIHTVSQYED